MRRKQLGAALRRLRRNAGVTMEAAAELLDCARSRIGHVESGRNAIRKPELRVLLDFYGASEDEYAALEELRAEASKRGWWSTYRLPAWMHPYVGLETDAVAMHSFDAEAIPGLLQTEQYSRRLHEVARHLVKPEEVDRLVAARAQRQARLTDESSPLALHAVVSEAAFRRALGDEHSGAAEQMAHIVEMAHRDNVTVYVLPYSAGLHPSMSGSFAVLSFDSAISSPVGYQEYIGGGHLVDEPDAVARLTDLWSLLRDQALSDGESVEWIAQLTGK